MMQQNIIFKVLWEKIMNTNQNGQIKAMEISELINLLKSINF